MVFILSSLLSLLWLRLAMTFVRCVASKRGYLISLSDPRLWRSKWNNTVLQCKCRAWEASNTMRWSQPPTDQQSDWVTSKASRHDSWYISLRECLSMTMLTGTGPWQKIESRRHIMTQTFYAAAWQMHHTYSTPPIVDHKRHSALSDEPGTLQELVRKLFDMYLWIIWSKDDYNIDLLAAEAWWSIYIWNYGYKVSSHSFKGMRGLHPRKTWHILTFYCYADESRKTVLISVSAYALCMPRAVEKWVSNIRCYGPGCAM